MNERIVIDPGICHGRPVIRGTRTPVSIILSCVAGGMTYEDIASDYDVTLDDVRAAVAFANEELSRTIYFPTPA